MKALQDRIPQSVDVCFQFGHVGYVLVHLVGNVFHVLCLVRNGFLQVQAASQEAVVLKHL